MTGRLICGDALAELRKLPANSIDLIVTSPPYADRRKRQYGGPSPAQYGAWYLPIARELKRVLKQDGSYILNLKESRTPDGQRSLYVLDLVAAHVREAGLRWHDTFIWAKPNPFPGDKGTHLPDAWEPCYQFTKGPRPFIDHTANRRPISPGTAAKRAYMARLDAAGDIETRAPALVKNKHDNPSVIAPNANRRDTPTAQAFNVVTIGVLAGAGRGIKHPAMFPERLPRWFIRLLCPYDGIVLDPFAGAGTTAFAAEAEGRRWIAIEKEPEYVKASRARLAVQHEPLTPGALPPPEPRSASPASPPPAEAAAQ